MSGLTDQMFADAGTASEKVDRLEALKGALSKSIEDSDAGRGRFVMKGRGTIGGSTEAARLAKVQEEFGSLAKSMDDGQKAQVAAAMAELDALSKDITAGAYPAVGSPGNLRPYDLEAPAKILVPRFTPLRNEIPRSKGIGGAREYRRILGYTNAGLGGVPDMDIFFNSETSTATFGSLALRRGNKISYSMDDHTVAYVEASVSDLVTYKAQFQNLGFENTRGLSKMALLWSHLIGEEKALLFGRGNTAQGYAGPFNSGNGPASALTIAAGGAGTASNSTFAGTVTVQATYRAGVGETAPSVTQTAATIVATGGISVTLPTIPAGAYGVNLYVNIVTNTAGSPAVGNGYFGGFYPASAASTTVVVNPANLLDQPGVPGSDNTSSNGYDGLLTVLTGPLSGYTANAPTGNVITTSGDLAFQNAFLSLFQSVYADPDDLWLNVVQRSELGTWLRSNASTVAYRIQLSDSDAGNATVGSMVNGIYNQASPTSKMVDIRVHPYMPAGCAIIRSRTLDIPDSGVGETSEVVSVQEYMAVDWPEIQFTYDSSTYWMGTFVHYAPAWSGAITGLS